MSRLDAASSEHKQVCVDRSWGEEVTGMKKEEETDERRKGATVTKRRDQQREEDEGEGDR